MKGTNLIILLIFSTFLACKKSENKNNWSLTVDNVISASSPREIDLNDDGILDIVMGAGDEEWKRTERGVIAIDGASGEIIWIAKSSNQIVGTAVFQDLNDDETPDVIIGGRSAELQALDGETGHTKEETLTQPVMKAYTISITRSLSMTKTTMAFGIY